MSRARNLLSRCRRPKWLLALGLLCVLSQRVWAQGSDPPRIALPIDTEQLQRFGDILGLSEDQRLAVEGEYEQYLDDFDPLRREMIEAAVANPRPSATEEQFTALLPGFVSRARTLDDAFFARIEPLLIESQQAILPRVRDLRERTMLARLDALARFIGDGVPEMRELLQACQPPPEVLAPLAPALETYEQRLTTRFREAFDATVRLCTANEPDDRAKEQLIEAVRSLRAMNRKLFDELAPSLPEDVRRKWRAEFLIHAYGGVVESAQVFVLPRIDAALASDLTEADRVTIEGLRAQARAIEDEALATVMALQDRDAIRIAPQGGAVASPDFYPTLNATREDVQERGMELYRALQDTLGKERLQQLQPVQMSSYRGGGGMRYACGVTVVISRVYRMDEQRGVPMSRSDPLLPAPLTTEDADLVASALSLDAQRRTNVMDVLHAHAESLEKSLAPLRDEATRATLGRPQNSTPDEALERARADDARRQAIRKAIITARTAWLEETRIAAGVASDDPTWQRIVRLYDRSTVALDPALRGFIDANHSAEIDVMRLLLQQGLHAETWNALDEIATDYEARLHGLLTTLYESYNTRVIKDTARRYGWLGEHDGTMEAHARYQAANEALHDQHKAVAALNAGALPRLIAALPAERRAALQNAYEQAAFPRVFADRVALLPVFDRAASLTDATAAQRERVGELRAAFATARDEVRREMVKVCAAVPPDLPLIGRSYTPERSAWEERFTLEFDRLSDKQEQINRRALRGLRLTLTHEQVQRLDLP